MALLEAHDALMRSSFPADSCRSLDADALAAPDVRFLAALGPGGRPLGCAALVLRGDQGEVKAMHVAAEARGLGVGRALLSGVERLARRERLPRLMLETGDVLTAARGLYAAAGFVERGPFGPHREDPRSVFMERAL